MYRKWAFMNLQCRMCMFIKACILKCCIAQTSVLKKLVISTDVFFAHVKKSLLPLTCQTILKHLLEDL